MTVFQRKKPANQQRLPLKQLLWRSYLRTSLVPLFVIEIGFLATYWVGETVVYTKNTEAVTEISRNYFLDIAHRETATISASLEAIASHTRVFARQTRNALDGNYRPPAAERARYKLLPSGGLHTTSDNGTTASFYSGGTKVGAKELDKVWRLAALDPFMISVKESNPSISAIYFNTFDSYNRIYPYIDASSQYSPDMIVPSYNFYYEADQKHNPERRDVWTDAYVDPAGNGWMVSSIAPVWRGETLEGVVGIDVTLETIIGSLLDLDLPWNGYAILVDNSGSIIALPPAGERDFGLTELTKHDYSQAIMSDTAKPAAFNLNNRKDTRRLADAMRLNREGEVALNLGGARLASFATVKQTGWRLVIIAPADAIYADARTLHERLQTVGYIMLAVLLTFYMLFFAFLILRARRTSRLIAEPLNQVSNLIDHIADRRLDARFDGSEVLELDKLGQHLVATRKQLLAAEDQARRQSRIARDALVQVRAVNTEMLSFTRMMSHEIRTPLSIIDSNAQIIQRKAETLNPNDLKDRAGRLRKTVTTVADLLSTLLARFDALEADSGHPVDDGLIDVSTEIHLLATAMIPTERLWLNLPESCPANASGSALFMLAVQEVLEHVARQSVSDSPVDISLQCEPPSVIASISCEINPLTSLDNPLDHRIADLRMTIERLNGTVETAIVTKKTTYKLTLPILRHDDI